MASSINADNGVSSGSAGLKSTADSSGVLALQTNGTTAISIDTSQAVSFTNQPTYSGGTANGVAYLNGSKVLTTGSALVFDGTNLRVGTTSSLSVADKMTVVGGNFAVQRTSGITTFMGDNTVDGYAGTATNQAFALLTNSVERARIDTSGNLGLGVTPSAWSGVKAIEIASAGSGIYSFGATDVRVTGNAYWNGSAYKYGNTNLASMYAQNAGIHYWYNAASGTAGNSITWTQAMTLDASNNLSLGTTSVFFGTTNRTVLSINGTSTSLLSFGVGNSGKAYMYSDGTDLFIQNNIAGRTYVVTNSAGVYLASGGTSWTSNSDERKKDIIEPIANAISKVSALRAVIGKFKTDEENTRRSFLIAQDVQSVLPEAVDASNPDDLGVQYTEVIPLLVAAIKEQQALITQLQADVASLKGA